MRKWQLHEARAKLSQVVDEAISNGPQTITRNGQEVAIVIGYEEYQATVAARGSLVSFFRRSPLVGAGLDLERDQSPVREDFRS